MIGNFQNSSGPIWKEPRPGPNMKYEDKQWELEEVEDSTFENKEKEEDLQENQEIVLYDDWLNDKDTKKIKPKKIKK